MPADYRAVEFPPVDLEIDRRPDGAMVMTPREPLDVRDASVPAGLARQARLQPDKVHLAARPARGEPWVTASFAEVKARADALTRFLIDKGVDPARPLVIVSGNSIDHAVVRYGAMGAGVPVCPVSANYALLGAAGGFERLRHVMDMVDPGFVFAETAAYAPAVDATAPADAVVLSRAPDAFRAPATDLADVLSTPAGDDIEDRIAALDPDAPAAYMLTSGSTGKPKAVIHTQRMITSNLYQGWQVLGRAAGWDDVLLEWLPWSHVSGAFSSMAAAIFGGTFYIDNGKPLPGLFDETIENLSEVPLTYFTNVPAGYAMLTEALEKDVALRKTFFEKLRLMLYGGAGLPQPVYDRLQAIAENETGKRVFMTTGYGATETTSGCMSIYFHSEKVGIGLPMPGLEVKLVPLDETRFELRMKGPMVTPGYLGRPDLESQIRDEDGFYRIGDTARFHDPADPNQGLAFAGRLAEEFKLDTGTFVSGGELRAELVRVGAPLITDLVLCGENRPYLSALIWPNAGALAAEAGLPDMPPAELVRDPRALAAIEARLAAHNAACSGSSERIRRFALLSDPPNAERHEVSDKGTINQEAARRHRAADVERLYADTPDAGVVEVAR